MVASTVWTVRKIWEVKPRESVTVVRACPQVTG